MARTKLPPSICITFGDKNRRLSAEGLFKALESAVELIQSYEFELGTADTVIRWEVAKVTMNSPLTIYIEPTAKTRPFRATSQRIIKAMQKDFEAIESVKREPKHLNEQGIKATQALLSVSAKEHAAFKIGSSKKSLIELTQFAAQKIEAITRRATHHEEIGTIEGDLHEVSVHNKPTFAIWDIFDQRKITCNVTEEQFDQWKALLRQRVYVSGAISYRNRLPQSIQVELIQPRAISMQPFDLDSFEPIDITGDMSSEEYIRMGRDAT